MEAHLREVENALDLEEGSGGAIDLRAVFAAPRRRAGVAGQGAEAPASGEAIVPLQRRK
jgi:hypothetical protein